MPYALLWEANANCVASFSRASSAAEQTRDTSHWQLGEKLFERYDLDPSRRCRRVPRNTTIRRATFRARSANAARPLRSQLRRQERMHVMDDDASRQHVRVSASKLPRARPGQQEPEAPRVRVSDGLNAVEECGDALDLVDRHGANAGAGGKQLALEPLGLGDELAKRGEAGETQREIGRLLS